MPIKSTPAKFPQIRVTSIAAQRVEDIVAAINATGRSVSRTSYLSDLILAQPIPVIPADEKKPRRRQQQAERTIVTAQA